MAKDPFEALASSLRTLADAVTDAQAAAGGAFAVGSPADLERAADVYSDEWAEYPLRDAGLHIGLLITMMVDHLRAVAAAIVEPRSVMAPATVARGALEAAAQARYLLDAPDGRERLRRHMNSRLVSYREQQQLLENINRHGEPQAAEDADGKDVLAKEEARLAAVTERITRSAERHGFTVVLARRREPVHLDTAHPYIAKLVREAIDARLPTLGTAAYYQLCSIAHAQLDSANFFFMDRVRLEDRTGGDVMVEVGIDSENCARLLLVAPLAAVGCAERAAPHMGWATDGISLAAQRLLSVWGSVGRISRDDSPLSISTRERATNRDHGGPESLQR